MNVEGKRENVKKTMERRKKKEKRSAIPDVRRSI